MAERVVEVLEAVEVEDDQRALGPVAADLREMAPDLELERAAVEQPRDRVVVGEVLELAALADVLDLQQQVRGAPVGVADQARALGGPDPLAGGVAVADLALQTLVLARRERGQAPGQRLGLRGVQQRRQRLSLIHI